MSLSTDTDAEVLSTAIVVDHVGLADLAERINVATGSAEVLAREAMNAALRAGRLLIEAKTRVPHGEWEDWITTNCTVAPRTARAYMKLAMTVPQLPAEERQRVADLPLREAIRAIATKPEARPRAASVAKTTSLKTPQPAPSPPSSPRSTWVRVSRREDVERMLVVLRKARAATNAFTRDFDKFHSVRGKQIASLKKKLSDAMAALDQIGGAE